MLYLEYFTFPDSDREFDFFLKQKRTCYDSFYPFQILSRHHLHRLDFEPVTILYGGNGSGKTTALNVIGEKLSLHGTAHLINLISFRIIWISAAINCRELFRRTAVLLRAMMYLIIC